MNRYVGLAMTSQAAISPARESPRRRPIPKVASASTAPNARHEDKHRAVSADALGAGHQQRHPRRVHRDQTRLAGRVHGPVSEWRKAPLRLRPGDVGHPRLGHHELTAEPEIRLADVAVGVSSAGGGSRVDHTSDERRQRDDDRYGGVIETCEEPRPTRRRALDAVRPHEDGKREAAPEHRSHRFMAGEHPAGDLQIESADEHQPQGPKTGEDRGDQRGAPNNRMSHQVLGEGCTTRPRSVQRKRQRAGGPEARSCAAEGAAESTVAAASRNPLRNTYAAVNGIRQIGDVRLRRSAVHGLAEALHVGEYTIAQGRGVRPGPLVPTRAGGTGAGGCGQHDPHHGRDPARSQRCGRQRSAADEEHPSAGREIQIARSLQRRRNEEVAVDRDDRQEAPDQQDGCSDEGDPDRDERRKRRPSSRPARTRQRRPRARAPREGRSRSTAPPACRTSG